MNIVLCGLHCSGKTTIGKLVAQKLQREFFDTDRLIEKLYFENTGLKFTCREIAINEGLTFFRSVEHCILSTSFPSPSVIALGGGSLTSPENHKLLQSLGHFVYLRAPLSLLAARIEKNGVPSFLLGENIPKELEILAGKRLPTYEKWADSTIDLDTMTTEEAVTTICQLGY